MPKATVREVLKPFDEAITKSYEDARKSSRELIHQKHLRIQQENDIRVSKEYAEYLGSEKWARIRSRVMERAGGVCEGCLERPATQAHHLTYEHLFDEFVFELVALCTTCHDRLHAEDRRESGNELAQGEEEDWSDALPCSGCRFQDSNEQGEMWCGIYSVASTVALGEGGGCGPRRASFEGLK